MTNESNSKSKHPTDPQDIPEIPVLKARNEELERQVRNLEENLKKASDLVEFLRLQARSEELEKHNQTLKGKLEEAKRDKEDLKTTYELVSKSRLFMFLTTKRYFI